MRDRGTEDVVVGHRLVSALTMSIVSAGRYLLLPYKPTPEERA